MVAVHDLSTQREWYPARRDGGASRRPQRRPAGDQAVRRRTLPDRATRIRRRRLAVLVVGLTVALLVWLAVQALASLTQAGTSSHPESLDVSLVPVAGQRYVVQPGDTLWSIAAEIAPDNDLRPVVDALRAANGDVALEVGDVLTLDIE